MGKLIVIEGLDGSGKSTQLDLLPKRLKENGIDCKAVSFPDYASNSSALVKMYLAGEFGTHPSDVNPYAASAFYTVDRFASYKTGWGDYYKNGGTVISGRYTTSNAVHQASKLQEKDWIPFLDWLYDFEYGNPTRLFSLICRLRSRKSCLIRGIPIPVKKIFTRAMLSILRIAVKPQPLPQSIRGGKRYPAPKTASPERYLIYRTIF